MPLIRVKFVTTNTRRKYVCKHRLLNSRVEIH